MPRSSLAQIARVGHVYAFQHDLPTLLRSKGKIDLRLIGLADASTFGGFCERHDNDLFVPLEKRDFAITPETAFLLTFRAIVREIHDKLINTRQYDTWLKFERGRSMERQQLVRERADFSRLGTDAGLRDLFDVKERLDDAWRRSDYSESYFLAYELHQAPAAMCSGSTTPIEDFDGRVLQDLGDLQTPSAHVAFSSFASAGSGWLVFSWHGASTAAERLASSLLRQPDDQLPHGLFRYLIEHVGNTYLAPDWWERLSASGQDAVRFRMQAGVQPELVLLRRGLLLDDGLRLVDWTIKNVAQRRRDAT